MRVIIITGEDLEHRYVANRLTTHVPIAGIVVDQGKPSTSSQRLRRYFRRYSALQMIERVFINVVRKVCKDRSVRAETVPAVFGPENCSAFQRTDLVQYVQGINDPEAIRIVTALQPDVILVFGTGIVRDKVLSIAKIMALNLHTGVSPIYRGADCVFWPLHNNEIDMLGATVHECTQEVDGGKIFGVTRVNLKRDDNLFSVFARCVVAGAELYVHTVQKLLEGRLEGKPQDLSKGREYRAYMRGLSAEIKTRRAIRAGLIRDHVDAKGKLSP